MARICVDIQLTILRDFCYPDFLMKFNRLIQMRKSDMLNLDPYCNMAINAVKALYECSSDDCTNNDHHHT